MEENKNIIRILHFVPNLFSGGTETFIMNMYRNLDKDKFQFDFIVHTNKEGVFEKEIELLGGKIYRFPIKDNKNFTKYKKDLNKFFLNHKEYKIIHGAMPSIGYIYEKIAKKNGIKVIIAHSHSASHDRNIKGYIKNYTSKKMKNYSTINLACSNKAGNYLFKNNYYEIIHNAIDLKKYRFNNDNRNKIKNSLNLTDKIILGHVGRLSSEKNHIFLIKLMKILPKNYVLLCVGSGKKERKLKQIVKKENLVDRIIFVGNINNVNDYYQAFDLFLLPSLYEGLPTVAIEAQISGLSCILSNNITKEVSLTNDMKFLPLNVEVWKNQIIQTELSRKKIDETNFKDYDITKEVKKLENIYENSLVVYNE